MQLTILAKSSSNPDEPYELRLESIGEKTGFRCSCPAGEAQQLCKHLLGLLSGDCSVLYRADDSALFSDCLQTLDRLGALRDFVNISEQIAQLEADFKRSKAQFESDRRELKGTLCRKLREGY